LQSRLAKQAFQVAESCHLHISLPSSQVAIPPSKAGISSGVKNYYSDILSSIALQSRLAKQAFQAKNKQAVREFTRTARREFSCNPA